ncbi:uncharacterized protein [Pyxicephalus adspersus]|uniref:uncharacterized protein isoform X3 n=1 Tax=Pyxicephalus adspersus TaxID=30357 RepID=UPI003B5BB64F
MGDAITYSVMSFTNRPISSDSTQREDPMVTYTDVRMKENRKTKSNITQKVSLQPEVSTHTYACVTKPKKAAEAEKEKKSARMKKVSPQPDVTTPTYASVNNTKRGKKNKIKEVSPQEENKTLYVVIDKPNMATKKKNTTPTKAQQEHSPECEVGPMLQETTNNQKRNSPTQRDIQPKTHLVIDRRHAILLVCVLIGISLVILITVISLRATGGAKRDNCTTGRCPDLWISINDKCYFLSDTQKSQSDSTKDCTDRSSTLAQVTEDSLKDSDQVTRCGIGGNRWRYTGDIKGYFRIPEALMRVCTTGLCKMQ